MVDDFPDPSIIYDDIWRNLARGSSDPKSEYRWMNLSSSLEHRGSSVRTVVLRESLKDEQKLRFHSDRRAQKIIQIEHCSFVMAHFHDRKRGIQIRMSGNAMFANQSVHHEAWSKLSNRQRELYQSNQVPGHPRKKIRTSSKIREINDENFCVIEISILEIDWLSLNRAEHLRALFQCDTDPIRAEWITP